MKKSITFIAAFMLSLYSMGGMNHDGRIDVTGANGKAGQNAELTINVENDYFSICAWECQVTLPEGIIFKQASLVRDRCADDAYLNVQKTSDGSYHLTCMNLDYDTANILVNFTGYNGAIAKIEVFIPETIKAGNYDVVLTNCSQSTTAGESLDCLTTSRFTWTIEGTSTPEPTSDNIVSLTGSKGQPGQDAELNLNLNNIEENVVALSCRLDLPEGITLNNVTLISNRCPSGFTTKIQEATDGTVQIVIYHSRFTTSFSGNDGAIATISLSIPDDFASGEYTIGLHNISITSPQGVSLEVNETYQFKWTIEGSNPGPEPEPASWEPTDISLLDNIIYLNQTEGFVGQEKTLSFQMKNTAAIRGFQFDLYLPQGMTVAKSAKGRILGSLSTGRLPEDDEHTLTIQEQADGAIRFLCASQYDETFTGNRGEIVMLTVNIAEDMADGDYPIVLKNLRLSETDISKFYDTEEIISTFTVSSYTPGDINADGSVNVSDYIGIANHILGNTPAGFVEKAADVNEDNVINVSDYIGVANIILTGSPYGTSSNVKPFSSRAKAADLNANDNVIYVEPLNVDAGTRTTLSFMMKNTADIRGFQFDLYLPDGVTAVKNAKGRFLASLNNGRLPEEDEHTLTLQAQADGAIRFLCGSQYDETFTGSEGLIATLTIDIDANMADGEYPIVLKNMRLSETDISKFYDSDDVETLLTVGDLTPKICAKPTISYDNGKLIFNSETEGATCLSTITDTDIASYNTNEVQLSVTYNISVYATKEGFENSEITTATLCWIDAEPNTDGDVDAVKEMKAMPVLIQTQGSTITIQGTSDGTEIAVYSINGMLQASTIAINGSATLNTSLRTGSVAVVKIGEKAVKVLMK